MKHTSLPSYSVIYVHGTQGSPIVKSKDGPSYVCLWRDHLHHHGHYRDACGAPGKPYWEKQAALLRETALAVLTISEQSSQGWKRKDYHSLWRVEDVRLTENGLECRLVAPVCKVLRGSAPKKNSPSGAIANRNAA